MKQKTIDLEFDVIVNNESLLRTILQFAQKQDKWDAAILNESDDKTCMDIIESIEPKLIFNVVVEDASFDHAFGTRQLEEIELVNDSLKIAGISPTHNFTLDNGVLKHLLTHTTYDCLVNLCVREINYWDGSYEDFGD